LYSTGQYQEDNFNDLLLTLIENSVLTRRQLSIINRRLKKSGPPKNISTGAYYRQVKQCRKRIKEVIYTIILLRALQVFDDTMNITLERIIAQMATLVIMDRGNDITDSNEMIVSHDKHEMNFREVISVLENVVTRLVNL
jgi:hypothetical protein